MLTTRTRAVLSPSILLWRAVHGLITAGFLTAIAVVWRSALTGARGRWLKPAIAALTGEGVVVALNHGDCPLGPVGDRVGDPVPFFELVLSPAAAKRAIPALGGFSALGIGIVAVRLAREARSGTRAREARSGTR